MKARGGRWVGGCGPHSGPYGPGLNARGRLLVAGCVWSMAAGVVTAGEIESRFTRNARQLTHEGERNGEQYFSPDGKLLVFMGEREPGNPFFQIYIMDMASGECSRVSPGKGKTTCPFFRPGSDRLVFASTHLDPQAEAKQRGEYERRASGQRKRSPWDYDEHYDLFTCRRDGSELTRLTEAPGYDAEGAYSPDGKLIVFCSLRDAYPLDKLGPQEREQLEQDASYFGEIYIMNADGSDQRRLTDWPGYDGGPFFSPDGERIVWRHFEPGGRLADIYTMRIDGGDRRRLTDFGCMSWAPYYHPSGRYVVFNANKHGYANFELFLVDVEGERDPVRVTDTDGFDGLAVFTPDGKKLCWTSTRGPDGKSQIWLADWDHEAALAALREAPARSGPAAGSGPE